MLKLSKRKEIIATWLKIKIKLAGINGYLKDGFVCTLNMDPDMLKKPAKHMD